MCQIISALIHSTNTTMGSYWAPDPVPGTGGRAVSNTDKVSAFTRLTVRSKRQMVSLQRNTVSGSVGARMQNKAG